LASSTYDSNSASCSSRGWRVRARSEFASMTCVGVTGEGDEPVCFLGFGRDCRRVGDELE
jgi:hypothetical protein